MPPACSLRRWPASGDAVSVTELQLGTADPAPPRTESDRSLREYAGDPADLMAAVPGHDALLVHGAPVSAEVLDAAPLRLVCCARGGPVNVDVAAASLRGIPPAATPTACTWPRCACVPGSPAGCRATTLPGPAEVTQDELLGFPP